MAKLLTQAQLENVVGTAQWQAKQKRIEEAFKKIQEGTKRYEENRRKREIAPAMQTPVSAPAPYRKPVVLSALNQALGLPGPMQAPAQPEEKKYTIAFDPSQIMGYERARKEEQAAAVTEAVAAYKKELGQAKRERTFAKTIYQRRYKGREETLKRRLSGTRAASARKLREIEKEFGKRLSKSHKAQLKMLRQMQVKAPKQPAYEKMTAEELVEAVPAEKIPAGLTKAQQRRYLELEALQEKLKEIQTTKAQKKELRELPAEIEAARGVVGPATIKKLGRVYAKELERRAFAPAPGAAKGFESVGRALTTGLFAKKAFVVPRAQTAAANRLRRLQAKRMLYEMRRKQAMAQQMTQAEEQIPQYAEGVPMAEQVQTEMPQSQRYSYRPINPGNYGYKPSYDARDYTPEESQGGFFVPTEKMPQQGQDKGGFFKGEDTYTNDNPFFVNQASVQAEPQREDMLSLNSNNMISPKRRLI